MEQNRALLKQLGEDLHDARYGIGSIDEPVALIGDLAWLEIISTVEEFRHRDPSSEGSHIIRLYGFEGYHLPCIRTSKWLIGPKNEMITLRNLWIACKDKQIRHFIENYRP